MKKLCNIKNKKLNKKNEQKKECNKKTAIKNDGFKKNKLVYEKQFYNCILKVKFFFKLQYCYIIKLFGNLISN